MDRREDIGKWYDEFAGKQVKTNVNLRHYKIMGYLTGAGLTRNSKVLEIGCGIGTLTGLILKYLKKGEVVAVDISPASVDIARKRLKDYANVMFMVSDMTDFVHTGIFDFIVLPDVLEHIPSEQHRNLFRTLAEHMHENSVILIHLPHPRAIDFIRRTNPDQLQIVDQAIEADSLLGDIYANGLTLLSYISYPLFDTENDYAVITIKKKGDITFSPLPKKTIIARKFLARVRFFFGRP